MRQCKRDLWIGAKFTYVDLGLLLEAGCASRADVGYFGSRGPLFTRALKENRLTCYEYSNAGMTLRLRLVLRAPALSRLAPLAVPMATVTQVAKRSRTLHGSADGSPARTQP